MSEQYPTPRNNLPVAALAAAVVILFVVVGAVVILSLGGGLGDESTPLVVSLVGLAVTVIPSLIAAAFSERASKDIRNGTLVEKSRQGAARALDDAAPIMKAAAVEAIEDKQVMTRTGPVVTAELVALTKILGHIDRLDGAAHPPSAPVDPAEGDPLRP